MGKNAFIKSHWIYLLFTVDSNPFFNFKHKLKSEAFFRGCLVNNYFFVWEISVLSSFWYSDIFFTRTYSLIHMYHLNHCHFSQAVRSQCVNCVCIEQLRLDYISTCVIICGAGQYISLCLIKCNIYIIVNVIITLVHHFMVYTLSSCCLI